MQYISGRRVSQDFGVPGITTNDTVINVDGRIAAGIGTSATASVDAASIRFRGDLIDTDGLTGEIGYFLTKDAGGLVWSAVNPTNENSVFVSQDGNQVGVSSYIGFNFKSDDRELVAISTNTGNPAIADIEILSRWHRGVSTLTANTGIYTSKNIGIGSADPIVSLDVVGDGNFTGIVTANKFAGNSASVTNLNVSGVSTFVGISTFSKIGIGLDNPTAELEIIGGAKISGILTANSIDVTGSLSVSSATTATNLANGVAGQISYQTAPGITGFLTTGISNLVLTSNGPGQAPTWQVAGIASDANIETSGIITATGGFVGNLTGTATTANNLSNAANITTGTISSDRLTGNYDINITGNAANATTADDLNINATNRILFQDSNQNTVALGHAINTTYLLKSGSSSADPSWIDPSSLSVAFANDAAKAGIATTALNLDGKLEADLDVATATTATNLANGVAGQISYQTAPGITGFLTTGTATQVLTSNGPGQAPTWQAAGAGGSLNGITILDEGVTVGSAGSISNVNFVGNGVVAEATAGGNIATVTFSIPGVDGNTGVALTARDVIGGIGSITSLTVSGISSSSAFADFDYLQAPFGSTVTFTVTVASKDSSHRYNGTGSGNAYLINGVQAPFLTLTPGRTYRFTNDNTGSHPLKFYLEADKTTEYTSGVNYQNTYTEITVSDETPTVLHYQCTAHAYMGNAIQVNSNVVNTNYPAVIRDTLNVSGISTLANVVKFESSGSNDGVIDLVPTGTLFIRGGSVVNGKIKLQAHAGYDNVICDLGPTELHYAASGGAGGKKLETTGYGVSVYGGLDVSGVTTFQSNINLGSGDRINFFTTNTKIYGNSNGLNIEASGTNDILIKSNSSGANHGDIILRTVEGGRIDLTGTGGVGIYHTDTAKKLETTGIGVSVLNGTSDTATISGPSNLIIDPAAVGDNTGLVRIKGDLFVDGTQTQINSTTIELADFIVGIATTATTDLLTDGAGIQIGPNNTFLYEYNGGTNPSLKSSENLNVASGKGYQINQTEVLNATTLGTGVTSSSLQSVGDLQQLVVTGISTFKNKVHLLDSDILHFGGAEGNNGDLQIFHDSTNAHISNSTGTLFINQYLDNGDIALRTDDGSGGFTNYVVLDGSEGSVNLYHYGSEKLSTKSNGVTISGITTSSGGFVGNLTGTATSAGIATYTSEWILGANGSSDYTFTGPGFTGAENDPTLYLIRGQQYKFINNSGGSHPFRIQSTPNGSTGTQYNDGITNNDTSTGTLTWNVQFNAPDILYYQCTNHSGMGGKIYITNAGITSDVSINTTGIITASSFSGNGDSLTNVDADTLDSFDSTQFLRSDDADVKTNGDLRFNDSILATFGTSDDLQIQHNGNASYISNYTGTLFIDQEVNDGTLALRSDNGSGSYTEYIECVGSSGEVKLYHYGSLKLATKAYGIDVTGRTETDNLNVSGVSTLVPLKYLQVL